MERGRGRAIGSALLIGLLAVVAGAAAPEAQAQQGTDCRCVDRDGNDIENCSCFVMPRVEALVSSLGPARPRLGISVSTQQPSSLDAQGAEVRSVLEDGPADEAGIREGDIITRIDGRSLLEPLDASIEEDFDEDDSLPAQRLLALARELEPGEAVEIEYLRDGERRTATLEAEDLGAFGAFRYQLDTERMRDQADALREQLEGAQRAWRGFRVEPPAYAFGLAGTARYGIETVDMNPGLAEYFGTAEGVLVVEVDDDSPFDLEPGDVILSVGDRPVTTRERLLRLLATYEEDEIVTLRVRRDGAELTVQGRID